MEQNKNENKLKNLHLIEGVMNSGKSNNAINTIYNYRNNGKDILVLKPMIDTKGADYIVSRAAKEKIKVDHLISKDERIVDLIDRKYDAIIVDEAQFLTEAQAYELHLISSIGGITVMCFALKIDFQGNLFPATSILLANAERRSEIITMCENCGNHKATHQLRLVNGIPTFNGNRVEIDNQDDIKYISVCSECFYEIREQYDINFKIDDKIKLIRFLKKENIHERKYF